MAGRLSCDAVDQAVCTVLYGPRLQPAQMVVMQAMLEDPHWRRYVDDHFCELRATPDDEGEPLKDNLLDRLASASRLHTRADLDAALVPPLSRTLPTDTHLRLPSVTQAVDDVASHRHDTPGEAAPTFKPMKSYTPKGNDANCEELLSTAAEPIAMPAIDKYLLNRYILHRDLRKLDRLTDSEDLQILADDMNRAFKNDIDGLAKYKSHSGAEYKTRMLRVAATHGALLDAALPVTSPSGHVQEASFSGNLLSLSSSKRTISSFGDNARHMYKVPRLTETGTSIKPAKTSPLVEEQEASSASSGYEIRALDKTHKKSYRFSQAEKDFLAGCVGMPRDEVMEKHHEMFPHLNRRWKVLLKHIQPVEAEDSSDEEDPVQRRKQGRTLRNCDSDSGDVQSRERDASRKSRNTDASPHSSHHGMDIVDVAPRIILTTLPPPHSSTSQASFVIVCFCGAQRLETEALFDAEDRYIKKQLVCPGCKKRMFFRPLDNNIPSVYPFQRGTSGQFVSQHVFEAFLRPARPGTAEVSFTIVCPCGGTKLETKATFDADDRYVKKQHQCRSCRKLRQYKPLNSRMPSVSDTWFRKSVKATLALETPAKSKLNVTKPAQKPGQKRIQTPQPREPPLERSSAASPPLPADNLVRPARGNNPNELMVLVRCVACKYERYDSNPMFRRSDGMYVRRRMRCQGHGDCPMSSDVIMHEATHRPSISYDEVQGNGGVDVKPKRQSSAANTDEESSESINETDTDSDDEWENAKKDDGDTDAEDGLEDTESKVGNSEADDEPGHAD